MSGRNPATLLDAHLAATDDVASTNALLDFDRPTQAALADETLGRFIDANARLTKLLQRPGGYTPAEPDYQLCQQLARLASRLLRRKLPFTRDQVLTCAIASATTYAEFWVIPHASIVLAVERYAEDNEFDAEFADVLTAWIDNLSRYNSMKEYRTLIARLRKLSKNTRSPPALQSVTRESDMSAAFDPAATSTNEPTATGLDSKQRAAFRKQADGWVKSYLAEISATRGGMTDKKRGKMPSAIAILDSSKDEQAAAVVMLMQSGAKGGPEEYATTYLLGRLFRRTLPYAEPDIIDMLSRVTTDLNMGVVSDVLKAVEQYVESHDLPEGAPSLLENVKKKVGDWYFSEAMTTQLIRQIDALLGTKASVPLNGRDVWAKTALGELENVDASLLASWSDLLTHCESAKAGKPTAKWQKTAGEQIDALPDGDFEERLLRWLPLFDKYEVTGHYGDGMPDPIDEGVMKGLLWCTAQTESPPLARAVSAVAVSGYKKIKGIGARAIKIGNAAVWALGAMPLEEAVGQLAYLKAKVKFGTAQKGIEKALTAAAERMNIDRSEIEELGVPTYGLTNVGLLEQPMGDFTARLEVVGTSKTQLTWIKPDGKTQKSVPAAVKKDHPEELKTLKGVAKDVQKMLPAQRDRIDNLFLEQKSWPLDTWRTRYLDHPLVGTLARRIIWRLTSEGRTRVGCWHDDGLVTVDDVPLELTDDTVVELWHPIDQPLDDVLAWREWLQRHQVQQPFKQAHREVYLLTDAERNTGTYSNRFAAHVLRQHQFKALCDVRGWKYRLGMWYDGGECEPAARQLPAWGLWTDFWINEAGEESNDTGVYLYVATDQLRFYEQNQTDPLPLEEVPPLVLSEVMRDVDLFVGVCSVGNDPTWQDGGPEGRFRQYWHDYSFGDLSGTAQTRKQVLERLIPRLKVADRCSFDDKFLIVKGDVRTYRIHLGSGNILMEPNDQYLCIVPDSSMTRGADKTFLPFEGDRMLSIILSKALLLAADTSIKDRTILTQIGTA